MSSDPHNKTIQWLKQQEYSFLTILKAVKSEIRVSMCMGSGDSFFPGLSVVTFSQYLHILERERKRGKNNFCNLFTRSQSYLLKASPLWIHKPT